MTIFHDIELEIIRPGSAHNQLLSPLTVYTALCGESAPVNFSIDLEQHQLNERIARLRYVFVEGKKVYEIPESERQIAIDDMGNEIRRILEKLKNLLFEEGRAFGQTIHQSEKNEEHMIHLRLVSSAAELANLPFEVAVSPPATPSEGRKMLLDLNLPVVLTREIRRTRRVPADWQRFQKPKILIVAAQPGNLDVPLKQHVRAVRKSLEPWIEWPDRLGSDGEILEVENRAVKAGEKISILQGASISKIHELCSEGAFTHVHILAHGGVYEERGEKRFGLILCDDHDDTKKKYVSGEQLAMALQADKLNGNHRSSPTMVTLATCDSAAQGSLTVPGGSIAYDLHVAGIPWVVASQFPLSKVGSVRFAEEFYPRIFRGDDPRKVLFEVRRILYAHVPGMHDWASLVVYASLPSDFNDQVIANFESQMKLAIDTALDRADDASGCVSKMIATNRSNGGEDYSDDEIDSMMADGDAALKSVEKMLELWRERLPKSKDLNSRLRRGQFYGISGSVYKRAALMHLRRIDKMTRKGKKIERNHAQYKEYIEFHKKYRTTLEKATRWYEKAIEEWAMDDSTYHWAATQYLSLKWVLIRSKGKSNVDSVSDLDASRYLMAKELAIGDRDKSDRAISKAWACGTLAELEILKPHYSKGLKLSGEVNEQNIREYCQRIVELVGAGDFAVKSTRRQFERYKKYWLKANADDALISAVDSAISALSEEDDGLFT